MAQRTQPKQRLPLDMTQLQPDEQKSLTHGEFWIPEDERQVYRRGLQALNRASIPYVVSGLYAIHHYTGIYRKTKDLDLFVEPGKVVEAARALKTEGFDVKLEQAHWIAKAMMGDKQIDLIYGMGNGTSFIDAEWYRRSRPGILAAEQVRVAPPEELLWHRLFVSERHRSDMSDAVHLIFCRGPDLDWKHLIERVASDWRLLFAQLQLFDYVYPGHRHKVPIWVREHMLEQLRGGMADEGDPLACAGTLISRFSFSIDVNEWGMRDLRKEAVSATRALPIINEIIASDVWHKPED